MRDSHRCEDRYDGTRDHLGFRETLGWPAGEASGIDERHGARAYPASSPGAPTCE